MWKCKHCNKEFDLIRTTDKGNHARHCDKNPNRSKTNEKVKESNAARQNKILGKMTNFTVNCESCDNNFIVSERANLHPQREKYFCSRACANSIGGKAKAEKYGSTQYRTIAAKFHKQECIVCGVTDILDVHHIDENRENNEASNLVFLCPNDHYRLHRNNDENIKRIIEGHGTAWGGRFLCTEDSSRVQIPSAPPIRAI